MSCRKRWRWHFRDPKFKNFRGEYAFGTLTFPLPAPIKISRYAADYWYVQAYEINAQWCKKGLGLDGVGVGEGKGGCILKIVIAMGGGPWIRAIDPLETHRYRWSPRKSSRAMSQNKPVTHMTLLALGSSLRKSCVEGNVVHKKGDSGHCNWLVIEPELRSHGFPKANLRYFSVSNSH